MELPRKSRLLDLGYSVAPDHVSEEQTKQPSGLLDKDDLRRMFESEMSDLVRVQLSIKEKELEETYKKKYDLYKVEQDKALAEKASAVDDEKKKIELLVSSLKKSYQNKVSEDIAAFDEVVIDVVMQCLYKICSNEDAYKNLVENSVNQILKKISQESSVFIKVSESEINYLKDAFADADWIGCLRVDDKLVNGEMIFDDGSSSIYEIGLVNQLDVLRTSFIKLLRAHHAHA